MLSEHLCNALYWPSIINDEATACLPQVAINNFLAELPSQMEVKKQSREYPVEDLQALRASQQKYVQLVAYSSFGSSPRCTRPSTASKKPHRNLKLHQLFTSTKIKAYDNHICISLFSIAEKKLTRILLNHLNQHPKHELLLESQCGFH